MEARRMCPNCRAFVSSADRVCPYCDAQLGSRAAERRPSYSSSGTVAGLIPHARFTTSMILLINFAMYLASMMFATRVAGTAFDIPGPVLYQLGAKLRLAIEGGEWWRLVTAGFLHGGMLHILMNSWALFDLGSQVEEIYGSARLIVFYFVSTVAGFFLSTLWSPGLSVGSSAGIFGLIGVMIALGMSHRSALGDHIKALYTRWAIYGLLFGLLPFFQVDNAAHIGGLAAGFGMALIAGLPSPWSEAKETIWRWVSYVCLVLAAGSFALMFRQLMQV